jgi:hypothetical protein
MTNAASCRSTPTRRPLPAPSHFCCDLARLIGGRSPPSSASPCAPRQSIPVASLAGLASSFIIPHMKEKPLFIPLNRQYWEAFAAGTKTEEWRRHSPRWNARTCRPGRPVVLSCGYSGRRLQGVVRAFWTAPANPGAALLYGQGTECAVIKIALIGSER